MSHAPRLLIADDEEGLLFLMSDILRREGYEVEGAAGGGEALEWLRHYHADLLLLDLKLSDVSALQVVAQLRMAGKDLPFLIITGHGDERSAVAAMKEGALDYVMKGAGMLELLPAIVRRALGVVEREKRLEEAKQRHKHVIQTALDGFLRIGLNGEIKETNEAFSDLLGYHSEELVHLNFFASNGLAGDEDYRRHMAELQPNASTRSFTRLRHRNYREIEVVISWRREDEEFFGFVHDLSAQRQLEREIQHGLLEERRRFGHELHDSLGQQLTAIELMTQTLVRQLKPQLPKQAKMASEIATYIRGAVTQTRELAHGLVPVPEGGDGLMKALQELARMTSSAGTVCEFRCPKPVSIGNNVTASHMHRIAQEAVTNALKHSSAKRILMELREGEEQIELSIQDDGRGLRRRKQGGEGMGLQVIQHRARLIGCRLSLESVARKGVRIVCTLPKPS